MPRGSRRRTVKPPGERSRVVNGQAAPRLTCTFISRRVLASTLTYSRHLTNAFSITETTTCHLAAQGSPSRVGSSCGGIIILASAGSFPQAPSRSPHLVLGYFQLGSTSAFAPLVGHLGPGSLINERVPGAAPMQQPLTITTQTTLARDT